MSIEANFILDDLGVLAPVDVIEHALSQIQCAVDCREGCFVVRLIEVRRAPDGALRRFDELLDLIAQTPPDCPLHS